MPHAIGQLPARASSTSNPITASVTVNPDETLLVVMLKVNGATNRAGGALTWGPYTLSQADAVQKAAASPEASTELWYLENPVPGTQTLTIPNTGALTVFRQIAMGKARAGGLSKFLAAIGANGTSANPAPGAINCGEGDLAFATCASGATTWAPTAQAGTVIQNTDDGAHGGGTQYSIRTAYGNFDLGWTQGSDDWGAVAAAFYEVPPHVFNNFMGVKVGDGMGCTARIR